MLAASAAKLRCGPRCWSSTWTAGRTIAAHAIAAIASESATWIVAWISSRCHTPRRRAGIDSSFHNAEKATARRLFATHRHAVESDVVDMEAFAFAKVCLGERVAFGCAKYITDGADSDSATHWEAALEAAAQSFAALYSSLNVL
jgi:hypothetical protein